MLLLAEATDNAGTQKLIKFFCIGFCVFIGIRVPLPFLYKCIGLCYATYDPF